MAESVYKIIEVVGTSTECWEKAVTAAVERRITTDRSTAAVGRPGDGPCAATGA
jgi:flavin-binding protein dodecin